MRHLITVIASMVAVLASTAAPSTAQTITFVPNADRSGTVATYVMNGCSSYFQCLDEAIPESVNDSDYVEIASGSLASQQMGGFDLTNAQSGTITTSLTMNMRIQRQTNGGSACDINEFRIVDGSSSVIASSGATSYPTAGSIGMVSISTGPVELTAAEVNNLTVRINMDRCSDGWVRLYSVDVDAEQERAWTTILPNAERVYPSGWGYWGANTPNTWQNVDERVPSGTSTGNWTYAPVDATNAMSYELTTTPAGTAGRVRIGMHLSSSVTNPATFSLKKSTGAVVAQSNFSLIAPRADYFATSYTHATQAEIDAMYLEVQGTPGEALYWYAGSVDITPATVTGTVGDAWMCDGLTPVVGIAVNGTKWDTVPCMSGTGSYAGTPIFEVGDVITTYYDGQSGQAARYVVAAADSNTLLTGLDMWWGEVHVESQTGAAFTTAHIDRFDGDNDPDIPARYPVSGRLDVTADTGFVADGNFTPGTDVRTVRFWQTSGTYAAGSTRMEVTASGTGACSSGGSGRPFCIVGTFSPGTGIVSYQGTGNYAVSNGTYANLEIVSSSTNTVQLGTSAGGTINASSFLIHAPGGAPVVSTSTYSPTINISGPVTVNGTGTLSGSGSGTMTVGGNFSGNGNVNLTGGAVHLSNAATSTTLNATGGGAAWQFATLRTQNTSFPQRTITIPAASREIRVSALLAADLYADLVASSMTQPLTVTGNVEIGFGSSISAPPLLEVQGNITNGGTFYSGTGTVRLTGSGSTTLTWGLGDLYQLDVPTPSKVVMLATNIGVANGPTLNGGACGTPVTLRSNSAGVQRILYRAGPATVNYASFRDIAVSGPALPTSNSGDLGNNSNITFTGIGCTAPNTIFTHPTNASSGSFHETTLDARGAFHSSSVNGTTATLDRYRAEVMSSPLDASVRALFPLDGTGADRSATGATVTATGGATFGTGAFGGQAASFDGIDDQMSAPNNAAYTTSTYTVDLWFKTSGGTSNFPTMISRAGSGQAQFQIGFNRANATMVAILTTGNGMFEVNTPWAPWIDNAWHHVAMTVDGSKAMRLYVDGTQYGSTVTYTGTLHTPSAPIYIGGTQGFASNAFAGQVDDVQVRNVVMSAAEIAGYAATNRPHAQSIWQSTGYGTSTGAALGANCAGSARCADIVYGGVSLQREGARYYMSHQYRTTAGLWTNTASDWFETSDGITVSAPGSVALGSVGASSTVTASFAATTTCSNGSGCILQLSTRSDGTLLSNAAGTLTVGPNTIGAPVTWATGGASGVGFTVLSSTSGKDTAKWGTGIDFSNLALLKFTGAGMTGTTLKQTVAAGSETTTVGVRLDAGVAAPAAYSGVIDLVAIDAP